MRTLEHQTLLYDDDCPLCQVYTFGFIKTGMLDKNGRKPFSTITTDEQNYIDLNRAANEIALVDTKNKTVIYGIDSLLKVIGYRFPIVENTGHLKPVKFMLNTLYGFISYNRKVIIPSQQKTDEKLQCVPNFNVNYRISYILFTIIVTMLTLFYFSKNLTLLSETSIIREGAITIGQLVFQGLLIYKLNKKTILNYFGNLMTVSLMGSLMLFPLLLVKHWFIIPETLTILWFGLTVFVMFVEHFRRIKLLKLPNYLSYTWILYRVLILLTILILN